MNYQKGVCSNCNSERLIVNKAKRLCLGCNKKASIQRSIERKKRKIANGEEIDPSKLAIFYQQYWNRYSDRYCVECGIELKKFNRWHIHHLIPKKNWKDYEEDIVYNDDNCVFVCLECHSKAETNLDHTPKVTDLTKKVLLQFRKRNHNNG